MNEGIFKLLLMGDSYAGKSLFLQILTNRDFTKHYATIGIDFKIKEMIVDGSHIKLNIWDTAGQERFKSITNNYIRGAQGIIFMYKIDLRSSFNLVVDLYNRNSETYKVKNIKTLLIGNKSDRTREREVNRSEGESFANQNEMLFREVDIFERNEVEEAVAELVRLIMYNRKIEKRKIVQNEFSIILNKKNKKRRKEKCII